MEFRILGPVEGSREGKTIPITGKKMPTLLATLLLARGHLVDDSRISALLWGTHPPNTWSAQIYTYISRLRRILGKEAHLVRRGPGYYLDFGDCQVDLLELERLRISAQVSVRQSRYQEAADLLRNALCLWRGPTLANVTEYLARAERPRMEEIRMSVKESRIEADLQLGRHHHLVPELTALVARYPAREKLHAQLMTALFRCDRQSEAIMVFHRARQVLADELGISPGPTLSRTYLAVLDGTLNPPQAELILP